MKFQSKSEAETRSAGRKLGKKLKRGDVVCLYGELGSGKTTMAKGIASAVGISERDVTSASFIVIAEHDADIPFYHIDLYRISPHNVSELGLREYLGSDGICVIEWAERAGEEIPEKSIRVRLRYTGEDSREIEITGIEL